MTVLVEVEIPMALVVGRSSEAERLNRQVKIRFRTIELTGRSGQSYNFTIFDTIPCFNWQVSCIYYMSHWCNDDNGRLLHEPLYIGQTADFNETLYKNLENRIFKAESFDSVSILQVKDGKLRSGIEFDLINELRPVYNVVGQGDG